MAGLEGSSGTIHMRGAFVVLSFVAFGLVVVVRFLIWGAQPLWGLIVVPPISMLIVFAWLASKPDPDRGV